MWNPRGWTTVKRRYSIFKKKKKKALPYSNPNEPDISGNEPNISGEVAATKIKQPQASKIAEFFYSLLAGMVFALLVVVIFSVEGAIVWTGASLISGEWALGKSFIEYFFGFFLGNIVAAILCSLFYVGINWLLKKIIKLIVSRRAPARA